MKQSDWQPMDTAPLNPYGESCGPHILVWHKHIGGPVPVHFEPWFDWDINRDPGPSWVIDDGIAETAIDTAAAVAWMPIVPPKSQDGGSSEELA